MENNIQNIYADLGYAFSQLATEEKRKEITNKINEMAEILNQIDPIADIVDKNSAYTTEDEYLCYLNGLVYNLENKIGNIFKKITQ